MQIVIDIPEKDFEIMKHNIAVDNPLCTLGEKEMVTVIANGTPLPKGHGRLIDENELMREAIRCEWSRTMYSTLDYTLSYMKPIIEADKAESEVGRNEEI